MVRVRVKVRVRVRVRVRLSHLRVSLECHRVEDCDGAVARRGLEDVQAARVGTQRGGETAHTSKLFLRGRARVTVTS